MKCPKCHKLFPNDYRFCPDCRVRLEKNIEEVNTYSTDTGKNGTYNGSFTNDKFRVVKHKVTWDIVKGEVARVIKNPEFDMLSGVSGIIIPEGLRAEVYIDGTLRAYLGSGVYNFVDDDAIDDILNEKVVNWRSLYGVGSKLIRGIAKLVCGRKIKDNIDESVSDFKNRSLKSLDQIIDYLKKDSIVTVYLMVDKQFTLLFGTCRGTADSDTEFCPYRIKTKYLDVNIGLSLLFEVNDFKQIIKNFLLSQSSVTTNDVQSLLAKYIPNILQIYLKNVDIEKEGIPTDLNTKLASELQHLNDYLLGFKVVGIGKITYESQELDRYYEIAKELYCGEKEMDFLRRTNEFKNRLSSVVNEQLINKAKNSLEVKKALDNVNHDGLLHDEEEWLFHTLLTRQRTISEAKNKLEEEKALSEIRQTGLLNKDEELALEQSLELKQFDRKNVALVMRAQSIAASVKQRLNIQAELNGIKFTNEIDLKRLKIEKESELAQHKILHETRIDDSAFESQKHKLANVSEKLDITAIIYGKQFQQEKKELQDKIELSLISFRSQMLAEQELAEHQNKILESQIEGRKIADKYNWEERLREAEFDDERRLRRNKISALERETDYELDYKKREKDLDLIEKKRKGALDALAQMKAAKENAQENEFQRKMVAERFAAQEREKRELLEHEIKLKDLELRNEHDRREHELEELRVDAERQMTSEQLAAKNLAQLDAEAQVSFTSQYSSAKENEFLKKILEKNEEEIQRRSAESLKHEMLMREDNKRILDTIIAENSRQDQIKMDLAASFMGMTERVVGRKSEEFKEEREQERTYQREGMDRLERLATHRMEETHSVDNRRYEDLKESKEEYRQQMIHQQERLDDQQDKALNYTTRYNNSGVKKENELRKESVNEIYSVQEMGDVPFTLTQLVRLVANGIINKRSIITFKNKEIFADDIPELKRAFAECDFIVCPHCHFKVPDKGKFCPKCGEDLY